MDDLDDTAALVWPENVPAVNAFIAMSTQWRTGMAGVTGLDYAALPPVLEMTAVARDEWPDVFDGVRTMEAEALRLMRIRRGS